MARIAGKGSALAKLRDDLVGVGHLLRNAVAGCRQEDLADAIFLRALRSVHAIEDRLHFVVADRHRILDLLLLQAPPCGLALHLATKRADRGAVGFQVVGELCGIHLHAFGDAHDGLVDILVRDLDLGSLGRLNLKRFVDQVAQHLLAQLLDLIGGQLAIVRNGQQRQPLFDVGLGDDLAIHDRRGLHDRGHRLSEDLGIVRKLQRARAAAGGGGRVGCILRCRSGRHGQHKCCRCKSKSRRKEVECCWHFRNSLVVQPNERIGVYSAPLNAGLAAETLER